MEYQALVREIEAAPQTWVPGLVAHVVRVAKSKDVFRSDEHLLQFVRRTLEGKSQP